MKCGAISASWLALNPTKRLDAEYWLLVLEALRSAGVEPATATNEQVKLAIDVVELDLRATKKLVAQKREQAMTLLKESSALEKSAVKPTWSPRGKCATH